jgi:phospholipid-transporting ATPase
MSPLLKNLKELSEQGIVIANEEKSVSILFCDMMDFSRFVASNPPATVVAILDAVYSTFDELCVKNGVQKMETVGKTYMACAGLHGTRKDHAHAVAEMAEEMIALMKRCVDKNGQPIEVRIGIHTGKVLSGVVGLKRPQYSLFGDTVNTSSRIQSTGEAGKIHLSAETYAFLKKDYRCTKRRVQAKGKGWLTTYFLGERVTRIPLNRKIAYKEDQDDITTEEVKIPFNPRRFCVLIATFSPIFFHL